MRSVPADDAELARLAAGGDRAALEELLGRVLPGIHAVCRRLCRDPLDAQDAAQDALIAVARGIPSFDGRAKLSTWVYRVTTNACHDELRRRRRRPEPADAAGLETVSTPDDPRDAPGADPEAEAIRAEDRRELAAALDSLPEDFRIAVVLRDVADLDYAAIADITAVPIGTVRSRIARGRARLADLLGSPGTERASAPSDAPETR